MVCEEDLSAFRSCRPARLQEAYARADAIDDALDARLAWRLRRLARLFTQCPTNSHGDARFGHAPSARADAAANQPPGERGIETWLNHRAHGEGSSPKGDPPAEKTRLPWHHRKGGARQPVVHHAAVGQPERDARKAMLENLTERTKSGARWHLQTARLLSGDEFMELVLAPGRAAGLLTPQLKSQRTDDIHAAGIITAAQGKSLTPQQATPSGLSRSGNSRPAAEPHHCKKENRIICCTFRDLTKSQPGLNAASYASGGISATIISAASICCGFDARRQRHRPRRSTRTACRLTPRAREKIISVSGWKRTSRRGFDAARKHILETAVADAGKLKHGMPAPSIRSPLLKKRTRRPTP